MRASRTCSHSSRNHSTCSRRRAVSARSRRGSPRHRFSASARRRRRVTGSTSTVACESQTRALWRRAASTASGGSASRYPSALVATESEPRHRRSRDTWLRSDSAAVRGGSSPHSAISQSIRGTVRATFSASSDSSARSFPMSGSDAEQAGLTRTGPSTSTCMAPSQMSCPPTYECGRRSGRETRPEQSPTHPVIHADIVSPPVTRGLSCVGLTRPPPHATRSDTARSGGDHVVTRYRVGGPGPSSPVPGAGILSRSAACGRIATRADAMLGQGSLLPRRACPFDSSDESASACAGSGTLLAASATTTEPQQGRSILKVRERR